MPTMDQTLLQIAKEIREREPNAAWAVQLEAVAKAITPPDGMVMVPKEEYDHLRYIERRAGILAKYAPLVVAARTGSEVQEIRKRMEAECHALQVEEVDNGGNSTSPTAPTAGEPRD